MRRGLIGIIATASLVAGCTHGFKRIEDLKTPVLVPFYIVNKSILYEFKPLIQTVN